MTHSRRNFLKALGLSSLAALGGIKPVKGESGIRVQKPARLKKGDTVGLISPAGIVYHTDEFTIVRESMEALELRVKEGQYMRSRYGYLAGTDEERASDVNAMFADTEVDAILCVRGGWGSSRILPLLDYDMIRENPKIMIGYSDITALLNAIHAKTGLITFHGPVGRSAWNSFTRGYFQSILFDGETITMNNPTAIGNNLTQVRDRVITINPGKASGRLLGGNLTVLTAMMGSEYLPDWNDAILFLEDVGEDIYRVDRMITQLKLNGVLDNIGGFVFGKCTECGPGDGFSSLTMEEVFNDHIRPLNIPSWQGSMIGHINNMFTIPVGLNAEIDANAGSIQMLEPAVI